MKLARGMRLLAAAACLVPALAHADPPPRDDLIEEDIPLDRVEHEASAGYDATVSVAGDGGGTLYALASLGGDVAYTASLGHDRSEYELTMEAAASVSRLEGTVRATGASTRLHLAIGPATVPVGNHDLSHTAPFPLTFELDHEGELAALPPLSARPNVLRAPYLSQRFAVATRAWMVEYAEDGIDETGVEGATPTDREAGGVELLPVRSSFGFTGQDGTRVDALASVGLFGVRAHFPGEVVGDFITGERRATQLPDGGLGIVDTLWWARAQCANPATGAAYEISFGHVLDIDAPEARGPVRDHRTPPFIGAIGLFSDPRHDRGLGVQYKRDAYVTMGGEPATEDRVFVEGWWRPHVTRLSARAFTARTRRELAAGAHVAWIGGVELDARREVGKLAVGLHAEGGQSYYATLDGGVPTPGFGARAALTVSRSARWVRGTR